MLLAQEAEPILRQLLMVSPEVQGFAKGLIKKVPDALREGVY